MASKHSLVSEIIDNLFLLHKSYKNICNMHFVIYKNCPNVG